MKVKLLVLGMAGALALAGCSGDQTAYRAQLQALQGTQQPPQPTSTPTPPALMLAPSETPDLVQIGVPVPLAQIVTQTVYVEVSRQVVQLVEATTTPQPAKIGAGAVDESTQPCPVIYWRKGRCIATDAQIGAYAQGLVQP